MPPSTTTTNRLAIMNYIAEQIRSVDEAPFIFGNPYVPDIEAAIENYVDRNRHIHYWVLERYATDPQTHEINPDIPTRLDVWYYHLFQLHLWVSVGVLSQESLQDDVPDPANSAEMVELICDQVLDHFKDKRSLGGTVWSTPQPLALRAKEIEFGPGNVVCHHAVFVLTAIDPMHGLAPA